MTTPIVVQSNAPQRMDSVILPIAVSVRGRYRVPPDSIFQPQPQRKAKSKCLVSVSYYALKAIDLFLVNKPKSWQWRFAVALSLFLLILVRVPQLIIATDPAGLTQDGLLMLGYSSLCLVCALATFRYVTRKRVSIIMATFILGLAMFLGTLYVYMSVSVYVYMCVCVCMCVIHMHYLTRIFEFG